MPAPFPSSSSGSSPSGAAYGLTEPSGQGALPKLRLTASAPGAGLEAHPGEPAGWLLLVDPEQAGGDGEGKQARSAGSLEPLADAQLLRALRNTGLPVRVGSARAASSPVAGGGEPQTTLIGFGKELESLQKLESLCAQLRATAGPGGGVLFCLLPEQPPLPAILLQAAERTGWQVDALRDFWIAKAALDGLLAGRRVGQPAAVNSPAGLAGSPDASGGH